MAASQHTAAIPAYDRASGRLVRWPWKNTFPKIGG